MPHPYCYLLLTNSYDNLFSRRFIYDFMIRNYDFDNGSRLACEVLTNRDLLGLILGLQSGVKYKDWHSADEAARCGHLSLIKMKEADFMSNTRRDSDCSDDNTKQRREQIDKEHGVFLVKYASSQMIEVRAPKESSKHRFDTQWKSIGPNGFDSACTNGHLDVVMWIHEQYPYIHGTRDAMNRAAANGHLDVVRFLHENKGTGCTIHAMNWAAENGHLEVVKYLHFNRDEGCSTYAFDAAAANGHTHVLEWLLANRTEGGTTLAMDMAARNGHLACIQWIYEEAEYFCTSNAMVMASKNGWLEVVQFLANIGSPITEDSIGGAAQDGHLSVLVWLLDNYGDHCPGATFDLACESNRMNIVEFLLSRRISGSEDGRDRAAAQGHLAMTRFLHERTHLSCTGHGLYAACTNGFVDIVKFLIEEVPFVDEDDGSVHNFQEKKHPSVLPTSWSIKTALKCARSSDACDIASYLELHLEKRELAQQRQYQFPNSGNF